jgi:hypothetical protein
MVWNRNHFPNTKINNFPVVFSPRGTYFFLQCFVLLGVWEKEGGTDTRTNGLIFGYYIQSVRRGKVNIPGGHSMGYSKKKVYMNMCLIPNGFRYLARSNSKLARNIFLPSNCNAPLSEACE